MLNLLPDVGIVPPAGLPNSISAGSTLITVSVKVVVRFEANEEIILGIQL